MTTKPFADPWRARWNSSKESGGCRYFVQYALGQCDWANSAVQSRQRQKKVLTESLRELEARGIVVRRDLSGTVRHVEYDFSDAMRSGMASILDHLATLGQIHRVQVGGETKDHDPAP
jgi:DNA-binding HxlR family transcriptional regulator